MKLLVSSDCFKELILGNSSSRRSISNAIESLTKKNHIFVLALPSLDSVLEKESDPLTREIIWTQSKNLFLDFLPIRKEEISLAIRLSSSKNLEWKEWLEIATASLADLDGILCTNPKWKEQSIVKILLAQEVDLDGVA
ncbi:hypothetical protein EHQ81_04800 [Leptospira selangorensis]|uniref:PIN domain-containing protein n=1 Tax=Leptospira selangorensis TaxID=2484982 RepID=A0A5F2C033_9LEPT|nr:hypothetical protein [Leptospira selangorensis]TGM15719.1 hypothetical protein EHQ81_04800 [Leptospira selangorensis]TGM18331.1 hypothetical protein EHQ82_14905 [Leptospira selangorensis]